MSSTAWIFDELYPWLIRDLTVEREAFALRLGGYLVFGAVLLACVMVFDFARVRIVVEDRRSALGALLASVRFIRRNFGRVLLLYVLNGAAFLLVLALYAVASPGAPRSGLHMMAVLVPRRALHPGTSLSETWFSTRQKRRFFNRPWHTRDTLPHPWWCGPIHRP